MEKWTIDIVPEQSGRIALVTGANSGLGFYTSLYLAQRGAEVIMACRSVERGEEAAERIKKEIMRKRAENDAEGENFKDGAVKSEPKLSVMQLDLSDLNSVNAFAEEVKKKYDRLDLLINNAGVMVPPLSRTKQGFELQFGTNHLGHFALTGRLLPIIRNVKGSRIITVSSIAAMLNYIDFDDLNWERKKYRKWKAYGQSKLANQMFAKELAEKLEKSGAETISLAVHPGVSTTNLFKTSGTLIESLFPIIAHSPDKGALPTMRAACDPDVKNGTYWGPSGFMKFTGAPAETGSVSKTLNEELRAKLWRVSEELTGLKVQV